MKLAVPLSKACWKRFSMRHSVSVVDVWYTRKIRDIVVRRARFGDLYLLKYTSTPRFGTSLSA